MVIRMIWFFPSSKLYFFILPSKFYGPRSFFWKLFSNFVHMSFEVLLLVFLNCTMLLTFFEVGSSRACVIHVLSTSSAVGQWRLLLVSSLHCLKLAGGNSFFHVWNRLILHIARTHCARKHLRRFISVSVRLHASDTCKRTDKIRALKRAFFKLKDVDLDVKTPLCRAPKYCEAFFVRLSMSSDSLRLWLMIDLR